MESLRRMLFENPLKLYLVLAAAEVAVAACWYSRRTWRWGAAMLAPPLLAGAIALTAHLVVTDREQIASVLDTIAACIERGDLAGAGEYLDPDCDGLSGASEVMNKEALIALGHKVLRKHPVREIRATDIDTKVAGGNATTTLRTRVTLRTGETFALGWKVQWAKGPAGWRMTAVELPPILGRI